MYCRTLFTATVAISLAAGCHCPYRAESFSPGARCLTRTELYFGLTIPGHGGTVTDDQWQGFIDGTVTPLFPDGLTVINAAGQWREASGTIAREPTRIIILLHEPTPQIDAKIERIRGDYKQRFNQEAVMRVDDRQRVSF
ncbi:MAG TPA: DUF3574 domain-containing protein [Phycisphaerales bacterium]|nr:DUF3574 domain-containing protein [Phycisphaerales bacterium]